MQNILDRTMKPKANDTWVPFYNYGTYYSIFGGTLIGAPMKQDATVDMENIEDPIQVEYLVSGEKENGFLEEINFVFGTTYKYEDFYIGETDLKSPLKTTIFADGDIPLIKVIYDSSNQDFFDSIRIFTFEKHIKKDENEISLEELKKNNPKVFTQLETYFESIN